MVIDVISGPSESELKPGALVTLHLSIHPPGLPDLRYECDVNISETLIEDGRKVVQGVGSFPNPQDEASPFTQLPVQYFYNRGPRSHGKLHTADLSWLQPFVLPR